MRTLQFDVIFMTAWQYHEVAMRKGRTLRHGPSKLGKGEG
jgi:hypothetical protein